MNKLDSTNSASPRMASVKYALAGGMTLLRTQPNARIHLVVTIWVLAFALFLRVSRVDLCILVIMIAFVWCAEALNTALEFLADTVTEDFHPTIKMAKDVAAFAVLSAALGAASIGILIFSAYIFR